MTKQYQRAYLSVNPSAINMPPKRGFVFGDYTH